MFKVPTFRSGFNSDPDVASLASGLVCPADESQTQQQFAEECDINTLVRRFGLTGEMPLNPSMPMSGDFTGLTDFTSAMLMVRKAQEQFEELPAELRYRFANDPGRLIEFLDDPSNRAEAIKLGLVPKPPEPSEAPGATSPPAKV